MGALVSHYWRPTWRWRMECKHLHWRCRWKVKATTCSCSSPVIVRNSRETEQVSASSKVVQRYFYYFSVQVKIKKQICYKHDTHIIIHGDMMSPTISSTGVNAHLKSRVDSCKARFNTRTINTLRAIGGNLTAGDKYLYNSGRVRCTWQPLTKSLRIEAAEFEIRALPIEKTCDVRTKHSTVLHVSHF